MVQNINTLVAEKISKSNPQIQEAVVDLLASKEIEKRTNVVVQAIGEINKLTSEGRKFKPDVISYDDNGEVASSNWSKSNLDERNRHQEKLSKLERALEKALDKNDYGDLLNAFRQQPKE